MKLEFFNRTAEDQATIIREAAAKRGISAVMVEKDFWVSWTLAILFAHPEFSEQLVFKGGTSLSKVFGVIERFSEDIDLSVSPDFVGIKEEWVEEAERRNKRTDRMKQLEKACIDKVRERFAPELERIAQESLGNQRTVSNGWSFRLTMILIRPLCFFIIHPTKLLDSNTFDAQ